MKKVSGVVAVLIAGGALLVGIFIGAAIGRLGATAAPAASQVVSSSTPGVIAGDGRYLVGSDVQPGTYKSDGGDNCYWARLNAAGDDILANNRGKGPAVLVVQQGDGMVQVSGCAPFTKVS